MLPQPFIDQIRQWPQLAILEQSLLTAPSVSVRLNPAKPGYDAEGLKPVAWCPQGFYLAERPQFTFDPALHQGLYYVQDASSMAIMAAIGEILEAEPAYASKAIRYLDACAAPGGKTTAAIAALPSSALVVANEFDFRRAEILAENMAKWGCPRAIVTRGDTRRLAKLSGFFDIIAVDAPCSGEGMMRKDQAAVDQWSPSLVQSCAAVQRQILANAWEALAPGGWLIYSTCTFNRAENEENLDWLVSEYGAQPHVISRLSGIDGIEGGISTPYPCYRFLPGRIEGEGLFMALLRKPGGGRVAESPRRVKDIKSPLSDAVRSWLAEPDSWTIHIDGEEMYARPKALAADMEAVCKVLDAISPGLHVATVKGRDLVPAHELALSTALRSDAFAQVEVDKSQAIAYLQRQPVTVSDAPKGYVLLAYAGHPLGFEKNLGNRANNLYPKNWRIRDLRP